MKKLIVLFLSLVLSLTLVIPGAFAKSGGSGRRSSGTHYSSKKSSTYVRGYTKKNGTYVAPHRRSTPDKSKANNWSSKGNVNPYTGKKGTKDPYK